MKITFDSKKSVKNKQERGLPFESVIDFDWDTAISLEDKRYSYPEKRFIAMGYLYARLHVLCFTPTVEGIRVISFRKANLREVRRYEEKVINR